MLLETIEVVLGAEPRSTAHTRDYCLEIKTEEVEMNQAVPAVAAKTTLDTACGMKCAYGPYDVSSKLVA